MSWNAPVNGDWSTCDFTQPPFAGGIATLTHEEVLFVIETTAPIAVGHENDDFYVTSQYNIAVNYEKGINQDTYVCIKGYDPNVNTLGTDANGIIQPISEEPQPQSEV
jgi:hypothetical protein